MTEKKGALAIYDKIPSLLFEFSISSPRKESLILPRLVLEAAGFKEGAISETIEDKQWILKVFSEEERQIDAISKSFKRLKFAGIKFCRKSLKPDQWLTRWKSDWKPLSLTKKLDVVPFWYKNQYKTSKDVIFLDTLMSFGTGMHETTQLIAQFIEDYTDSLTSLLDIGTGTGILTMVALKHGAKAATAMDISPLSIEAARNNLKVNNLHAKLILSDIKNFSSGNKYQMVAANLITDDLLKDKRKIASFVKPGGFLAVSGISLDNLKRLQDGFKDLPLTCIKVSKGKQWAAILYLKKMS